MLGCPLSQREMVTLRGPEALTLVFNTCNPENIGTQSAGPPIRQLQLYGC